MSKIGKKLVILPAGVEFSFAEGVITLKGPKGTLARTFPSSVIVEQTVNEAGEAVLAITVVHPDVDSTMWGTARAHVQNMVTGVTMQWKKSLELNGVGFRMALQGTQLKMSLGFSHEVFYEIPADVKASIEGNVLSIEGVDRDIVGKVASEIRSLKKPEPYKGKGFRYTDEIIRRKAGKAAKSE